jgi:hypothetical protein
MMNKLVALAAGAALLALTGTAYAEQPGKKLLALSDQQMDKITAGTLAIANAGSLTFGEVLSDTISQTSTNTVTVAGPSVAVPGSNGVVVLSGRIALGGAFSQGLAAGGLLFQAASVSHADTAAVW